MDDDEIGSIADLEISADGRVETIVLTDANTVAGGRLRAIGSYAAILNVDFPLRLDCRSLDRDQFADQYRTEPGSVLIEAPSGTTNELVEQGRAVERAEYVDRLALRQTRAERSDREHRVDHGRGPRAPPALGDRGEGHALWIGGGGCRDDHEHFARAGHDSGDGGRVGAEPLSRRRSVEDVVHPISIVDHDRSVIAGDCLIECGREYRALGAERCVEGLHGDTRSRCDRSHARRSVSDVHEQ